VSRFGNEMYRSMARALFLASGLVVLLWFLNSIRDALLVLILAIVIALALNAPITWLERRRLPRGLAVLVVFLALFALMGGMGWLVLPRLVAAIPTFLEEIPTVVQNLADRVTAMFGDHPEVERQLSNVVDMMMGAIGGLWQHATTLIGSLLMSLIILGLVLYLVVDPRPLLAGYVRAMPPHLRDPATRAFARSSKMVVGWVYANVILGGIKAASSFVFLTWMEVPGAIIWSVLSLFAALIPRLGFYLMSIPPVIMALSVDFTTALWVGLFYWALSEFLGAIVAPRIQGEAMQLHPAFLLFMAIAMALSFGLLGVLISAPLAGFLWAYFDEFYVRRNPEVEDADERVRTMMERRVETADGAAEP
jgi:putative permease